MILLIPRFRLQALHSEIAHVKDDMERHREYEYVWWNIRNGAQHHRFPSNFQASIIMFCHKRVRLKLAEGLPNWRGIYFSVWTFSELTNIMNKHNYIINCVYYHKMDIVMHVYMLVLANSVCCDAQI